MGNSFCHFYKVRSNYSPVIVEGENVKPIDSVFVLLKLPIGPLDVAFGVIAIVVNDEYLFCVMAGLDDKGGNGVPEAGGSVVGSGYDREKRSSGYHAGGVAFLVGQILDLAFSLP